MTATADEPSSEIPILDLSWADNTLKKSLLLKQLHAALFDVGFLYITNHGVAQRTIDRLVSLLPPLFDLPEIEKVKLSKINSPHFLGYSGFAEETTLGRQDLREQIDFATEVPVVWTDADEISTGGDDHGHRGPGREFSKPYWRLRGPNQYPSESDMSGFQLALTEFHDAVEALSYRFVHLVEEAFGIEVGTFDGFFQTKDQHESNCVAANDPDSLVKEYLPPQHRIKLVKYPPTGSKEDAAGQGVGAHKDSSGWLTFLYQVGQEEGLEVLGSSGEWLKARPLDGSFVVNFGNAFEAATDGAVRATTHRVTAPTERVRYSIPFFQSLPLDMTVSEIRGYIPEHVRQLRKRARGDGDDGSTFLDPRWDRFGESQLRKWIRSHEDVGRKWYGDEAVEYYTA